MRRTTTRKTAVGAASVGVTLLLAGCGGGPDASEASSTLPDVSDADLQGVTITVGDFFGDCLDAVRGETDPSKATTECESMRILNNKFNAENPYGITVKREAGSEWSVYYDAVNAAFAAKQPPDILFMHASNIPDYSGRNLLLPLDDAYGLADMDPADMTEPAREGVTDDGTMYGVPHDVHGNLLHLNMDLMKKAGLVQPDGSPTLPSSPQELKQQARQFEQATGKQYIAWGNDFNIPFRIFWTLVSQQGQTVVDDSGKATLGTPAAHEALGLIADLYQEGIANPEQTYDSSQQAWLNGQVGMLVNGTWVVGEYDRTASFDYRAEDFPTLYDQPAVWANSHTWVIPVQENAEPRKYRAALEYAAFMFHHSEDWAVATGHLSFRPSVLDSKSYRSAPQRSNYVDTAQIASLVPQVPGWQGAEDSLERSLEPVWLSGASVDSALSNAQSQVDQQLDE